MPATLLLLILIAIATVTDLVRHKIYNWTTYPGILIAVGGSALGEVAWGEAIAGRWGFVGLAESVLGLLSCGLLMLVCFVLFRIGGGDVKLIAMLGAFLGSEKGIEAMLWTFVFGGCMGLIVLIWRVGPGHLAARIARQAVYVLRVGGWSPLTAEERVQLQPPLFLAPCALGAVLVVRFSLLDRFL